MGKLSTEEVARLLEVRDGRPVHSNPLISFRLGFYPERGYWRRTRSHRDQVPREKVAHEVGVPLDVLILWEEAAKAPAGRPEQVVAE